METFITYQVKKNLKHLFFKLHYTSKPILLLLGRSGFALAMSDTN